MSETIHLVHANPHITKTFSHVLCAAGFEVHTFADLQQVPFSGHTGNGTGKLCIVEARQLLARGKLPTLASVAFLSPSDADLIEPLRQLGVAEFIEEHADERILIHRISRLLQSKNDHAALKLVPESGETDDLESLWEHSPGLTRAVQQGIRALRTRIPTLIEGEEGVGKSLFARALCRNNRSRRIDVEIDCREMNDSAVKKLLMNACHIKSSRLSNVLIENIDLMSQEVQDYLANLIDEKKIALESNKWQLVMTSRTSLLEKVRNHTFNARLFYLVSVFPIKLAPLRDRREDVARLAKLFLRRVVRFKGGRHTQITPEAYDLLFNYDWPGNIRELENKLYRVALLSEKDHLSADDFQAMLVSEKEAQKRIRENKSAAPATRNIADKAIPFPKIVVDHAGTPHYGKIDLLDAQGQQRPLHVVEQEAIRFAVRHAEGNYSIAARDLRIGRTTLYRRLKSDNRTQLGEEMPELREAH